MPRELKTDRQDLLTQPITVAVLGSGGREHALAHKISQSRFCKSVVVLPGNPGMKRDGIRIKPVDFTEHEEVAKQLKSIGAELVVVGPDDLLAAGIVDFLEDSGFPVFGPRKAAAKLEWSKAYAKEILEASGVPTARHALLAKDEASRLPEIVDRLGGYPIVLKFDGLALGKGVRICADENDAREFLKEVFETQKFSKSQTKSKTVVVAEEFLIGHEVSVFALVDGASYAVFEPACDHKRLLDGNQGPNTGGMGAYSPVPWLDRNRLKEMAERIFPPILARLQELKISYHGLLYAGLMVGGEQFQVLEFNARFGDPETQALLPRMESDLLPLLYGVAVRALDRHLDASPLRWKADACVNIVAASRGYPDKSETGFTIEGLEGAENEVSDHHIYFSGVKTDDEGAFCTSGGRVLSVTARGDNLEEAGRKAVEAMGSLRFEGMQFRRDIGRVRPNF